MAQLKVLDMRYEKDNGGVFEVCPLLRFLVYVRIIIEL